MEQSGVHVSTKTIDETIINPTAAQYKEALPDTLYAYLHYKIAVGIGDAIRQTAEDAETGVVGELLNTPKTTMSPASHQGAGLSYDIMWQVREAVTDELCKGNRKRENIKWQRFKGLGEMNVDELRHCALNPATRTLKRLTMDDANQAKEAAKMFDVLMGNDVGVRRDFLVKNSALVDTSTLDV